MRGRPMAGAAALGVVCAVGCSSSSNGNGKQAGELGRGVFGYSCVSAADAQCNNNADVAIVDASTNLPSVAVGATFYVTYASNASSTNNVPDGHVDTVDTTFIDIDATGIEFVAKRAGLAVLYGLQGTVAMTACHSVTCDGDAPEDLVHLQLQAIDHIEFAHSALMGGTFKGEVTTPGGGMVSLTVNGQPLTELFRVVPMTKDRKLLAGSLPIMWTSSDTTVGQITTDPTQNIVTLQLEKAGTTMLTATLATMMGTLTVTVN
jgi:hypothetical protein